jgi:hypothetical protein
VATPPLLLGALLEVADEPAAADVLLLLATPEPEFPPL